MNYFCVDKSNDYKLSNCSNQKDSYPYHQYFQQKIALLQ